jgi:hypothetical protein
LLAGLKKLAGQLTGGSQQDPAAALQSHFESLGLSASHLKSLLPKLHAMLSDKLPPQLMEQIRAHMPGFQPPSE